MKKLLFILLLTALLLSLMSLSIIAEENNFQKEIGWVAGGEISALTLYRDKILEKVMTSQKVGHMNTIYVTGKQFDGRLWYYSEKYADIMAHPGNGIQYTYQDNPLQKIIKTAHSEEYDQAVQVLFQLFSDKYAAEELFPEAQIANSGWVDPAYKPMQDYLIGLAVDLVKNYPVDGISLDFIRYPGGYSDSRLPYTGSKDRVKIINNFLKRITKAVRKVNPSIDISTNVFASTTGGPVQELGQDISKMAEIVDFVSPMLYPYTDHQDTNYDKLYQYQYKHTKNALAQVDSPDKIKPAVQAFFGYDARDIKDQINGVKDAGGTGVFIYAYDFSFGWDQEKWLKFAEIMPENYNDRRRRDTETIYITEPAAVFVSDNWINIEWKVSAPARAEIYLQKDGKVIKKVEGNNFNTQDNVWFQGLTGNTEYSIKIKIKDIFNRKEEKVLKVNTLKNLALGKNAQASSITHKGFEADKAVDNDMTTRWCSKRSDPQEFIVDLGSEMEISGVGIEWEYAYSSRYSIQVSNDKENWEVVYNTRNGNGGREDLFFKPVKARYVKLTSIERGTKLASSFWEFKIFH